MIKLYSMPGCTYCIRVIDALKSLNAPYEELNIFEGTNREALLEKGGKGQVPFMIDEEAGASMYESGDIINYLNTKYSNKK